MEFQRILAFGLCLLRGGTLIVRGILEKGRILPARSSSGLSLDIEEYNRGRIIGNIERLLLLIFVSIQAWSALAFLMAAKGRSVQRISRRESFPNIFRWKLWSAASSLSSQASSC